MISGMRIIRVGAAACAVTVALLMSGCGDKATAKPEASTTPTAAPVATVKDTWATVQPVFTQYCPPDDCSPHLKELVSAADQLRTSMHADPAGGAFFSEAYVIIDRMDKLRDEYEPLDEGSLRDEVLGLANQLSRWIETHPTS